MTKKCKSILIVDDDKDVLESMKDILTKAGYKVETAFDTAKTLESIETSKPNLILINIMISPISGYDLLKILRKKFGHSIKIAYVSLIPKQDADLSGVDGYIQKPFGVNDLLQGVKKILGS